MGRIPVYWMVFLALFFFSAGYELVNHTTESNANVLTINCETESVSTNTQTIPEWWGDLLPRRFDEAALWEKVNPGDLLPPVGNRCGNELQACLAYTAQGSKLTAGEKTGWYLFPALNIGGNLPTAVKSRRLNNPFKLMHNTVLYLDSGNGVLFHGQYNKGVTNFQINIGKNSAFQIDERHLNCA